MKKRLLAVILALCISSTNTMGAFAIASEGGVTQQSEAEGESQTEEVDSEGIDESEEPEDEMTPAASAEGASNGANGEQESINEENEISVDDEGDGDAESDGSSDNGSADAGDDELNGSAENNNVQEDETSQDVSSTSDGQTETTGSDILTEGQDGEITADAMSGECGAEGDNLTWELSGEADALTLTINGEGAMADYSEDAGAPWEKSAANIVTVCISDSVTEIGSYAFAGCGSIEELSLSENISSIGDNAFLDCDSLNKIYYAGTQEAWDSLAQNLIPEGVEVVCARGSEIAVRKVMLGTQESELEVGKQLQLTATIEPEDATNKNVTWSSSSEEVATVDENGLVTGVSAGTVTVSVFTEDGHYSDELIITVTNKEGMEIASGTCGDNLTWKLTGTDDDMTLTISGTGEMTRYNMPTDVPWGSYGEHIKSIEIEEGVTKLGENAFRGCTGLTSIEIPEGVQSIDWYVFSDCSNLKSITLPDSLKVVAAGAFNGCSPEKKYFNNIETWLNLSGSIPGELYINGEALTEVIIPEGTEELRDYLFSGCKQLKSIVIPYGVKSIGEACFSRCSNLTSIELPEGVTEIEEYAFSKCTSLTSINLPDGVKTIGENCFDSCSSLTSIELPEGVTDLGKYTFSNCKGLTRIELPAGLKTIGSSCFSDCYSLTSIEIPEGVTDIREWAFYNCSSFKEVIIPHSVTSIGSYAFSRVSASRIWYWGTLKEWRSINKSYINANCISISFDTDHLELEKNESYDLSVECNYNDIDLDSIEWNSSDEAVASVDDQGRVTAIQGGEAEITASIHGINCQIPVVVIQHTEGVKLDQPSLNLYLDEKSVNIFQFNVYDLKATIEPDNATNQNVTWISSDPETVTVDENGHIEALKVGLATITVTTEDGNYSASCVVTVEQEYMIPVSGLTMEKESVTIRDGETEQLEAVIDPEDAANQNVVWTSSDDEIASVDENGVVTGVKAGTVAITATTEDGNYSAVCTVTVEMSVRGVRFDNKDIRLGTGEASTLIVTFVPENASNKNLSWISSNEEVATVDESGLVIAHSIGTADITATTEDGNYSAVCTVFVDRVLADNVLLSKNNLELWIGRTAPLSATVLPENTTDKKVAWTSSNEEVVTADENGVVTAVGEGTATVTATSEDSQKSAVCIVTVKNDIVETGACGDDLTWTVSGSGDDLKLTISGTGRMNDYSYSEWWDSEGGFHISSTSPWKEYNDRINFIVIEDGVTRIGDRAFEYSGRMNSIEIPASVSEIGTYALLDCYGPINYWGTGDTWKSFDGYRTINPLNIEFGIEELVLGTGRTQYLSIICNHGECNAKDIIWSSSDDEIVTVDSWGRVTAKQTGEAVITASLYGAECEIPVRVVLSASEIKLDQSELSLDKGESGSLAVTVEPEDAAFKDIVWESSDSNVVTVDSDGTLTALRGGTAVVTASSSYWNLKDSCTVTVIAPVSGVAVAEEAVVDLNAEKVLAASVLPEDATNKNVIWTSSDEEVVKIDSDGKAQGISIGTAEVTATTEDGAYTAACLVRVITPVTAVVFDQENITLEIGQCAEIAATVLPEDAVDKSIVWESSDAEVASVDENGTINALGSGKATITATSLNGTTAKCEVVVPMPLRKITYVLNGGKNDQANPADYREGSIVQLKNPTRGGYIFGGWYSDAQFTKKATGIAAGQIGDKNFYAKWAGKTYKIVFNGNTANSGKMSTITYTMGKSTALPANAFAKKEYVFNGWNTRADGKGTKFNNKGSLGAFDAANGSTITLYAQWKIKQYTITYKLNGGTNNKANPASYNFKSANITLAKPTRKGYSFQGWFTDAKCTKAFTGIKKGSTGNRTVYAKWKANKYTIQYVLNKGTAPKGNPAAYYVTTATITLKNPTRKGYTFLGWYKEATFKTKVVSIPKGSAGNLKLYAKWKLTDYPIVYQLNGGTNNKANPATYKMTSKTFGLSNPSRKGFKFAGWYTDAKFTKKFTNIPQGSTGKKTVYAKWTLVTYTITYNLNGGKNAAANPANYAVTSNTINLADPAARTGYVFEGWYKDAGFNNKVTQIPKGSAGNITLYAKWRVINYQITYVVEDGTNSADNPDTYNVTSSFSFKEPSMDNPRDGFVFRGWYSDAECTRKVTEIKKGSIGDITLYAKWCYSGFSNFPDKMLAGQKTEYFETGIDSGSLRFRSSNFDVISVYGSSSISLEAVNPGIARIELLENGKVIDSINVNVLDYSNAKVVVATDYYDISTDKHYDKQITFPGTKTCFVSDRMDFGFATLYKDGMSVNLSGYYDRYSIKTTNPSVAEVNYNFVTLKKAGTCKVLITGDYNLSEELTVTVKDRVITPCIVEQRNVKVGSQSVMIYSDSIRLDIKDVQLGDYEIYRSTSLNSGYTKISTGLYDKNLKPNTKYYYKARVKLKGQNVFGPFSKPVAYWTAPKGTYYYLDSTNKITYNKSTHKISWPKINGATGYYVIPYYNWFRGYNIFGQRLYTNYIELKRTTNTSIDAWKCSGYWPVDIRAVVPYAVHNGYIYMNGYRLTNSFTNRTQELRVDYQ